MHGPCRPPNKLALMPCTPPQLSHTSCRSLTARADRPVRDPADAVAFTTAVAIGGAGSVHRRTGMRAAPPATDCRQNPPPALPVNHMRCSADHRPAWRCEARPDVRRAVGVRMMGRPRQAASVWHQARHSVAQKKLEVQNDTQRTARARGVSRGEPAESRAARFSHFDSAWQPALRA